MLQLLLLTLAMDDDVLRTHTCFGEELLVQKLLHGMDEEDTKARKKLLLQEARSLIASPSSHFCLEMLRRVVGCTKQPATHSNSKKDKILDEFMENACVKEKRKMVFPTLLQVII